MRKGEKGEYICPDCQWSSGPTEMHGDARKCHKCPSWALPKPVYLRRLRAELIEAEERELAEYNEGRLF